MSRCTRLRCCIFVLFAPMVWGAAASAQETLYTLDSTLPIVVRDTQKSFPAKVNENRAIEAIFKGGMWLTNPSGGRIYARYQRHIMHDNGDWTWIGTVATAHGMQSAVITFGNDAAFGLIPQPQGFPLRITTAHGRVALVQTSDDVMSRSSHAQRLWTAPDFALPPRRTSVAFQSVQSHDVLANAASGSTPIVDVMIAYTPGFVSEYGSQSAALTRINYVVDVANQAYVDSQVHAQIRLVHTVEVNYPDNTYDPDAVSDLTGVNIQTGQPVQIPASLSQIHALRAQYGADLVSMERKYNDATNGYCGFAWIIGADGQPIDPSSDYTYGYSVVGDGSDNGYFCYDTGLAHELGHNMGSVHDHAHPSLDSKGNAITGEYPYSYGYATPPGSGFFTIMAYGAAGQSPVSVFSNPNIVTCQNQPCGVPNQEDNARSLNQTISLVAQFEFAHPIHNDVNGDGKSDLLFNNADQHIFSYWLMNGTQVLSMHQVSPVGAGYWVAATGDFNGDGLADIIWTSAANNLYMWTGNSTGFTSTRFGSYPAGWQVVGAGDVDGDGKSDLLFYNATTHQFSYRIMNGTTQVREALIGPVGAGYWVAATGDFNGDGKADIVWTSAANDLYMWTGNGTGFTSTRFGGYPEGWQVIGAGDVDGDGKSDMLFYNATTHQFSYRIMSGTTQLRAALIGPVGAGYRVATTGDFNGDGKVDIVWTSAANDLYMWAGDGTRFTSQYFDNYPSGWMPIAN